MSLPANNVPVAFRDFTKRVSGLLVKDGWDTATEVKATAKSGDLKFDAAFRQADEASGKLAIEWSHKCGGKAAVTLCSDNSRNVDVSFAFDEYGAKGVSVKASSAYNQGTEKRDASVQASVARPHVVADAKVQVYSTEGTNFPVELSASTGRNGVFVGGSATVQAGGDANDLAARLTDASAGLLLVRDTFHVSAVATGKGEKAAVGFVQAVSADLDVGAQVEYNATKKCTVFAMGAALRQDGAVLKGRVNSCADAAVSFSAPINSRTKLTVVARANLLDLNNAAKHAVGLQIALV